MLCIGRATRDIPTCSGSGCWEVEEHDITWDCLTDTWLALATRDHGSVHVYSDTSRHQLSESDHAGPEELRMSESGHYVYW